MDQVSVQWRTVLPESSWQRTSEPTFAGPPVITTPLEEIEKEPLGVSGLLLQSVPEPVNVPSGLTISVPLSTRAPKGLKQYC